MRRKSLVSVGVFFGIFFGCAIFFLSTHQDPASRPPGPVIEDCRELKSRFRSIQTGHWRGVQPAGNRMALDSFLTDLNADGSTDDLITIGLPYAQRGEVTSTIGIVENRSDGVFEDVSDAYLGRVSTEHARHVAFGDINMDGRADFVVADHGRDQQPFLGGLSRLILSGKEPDRFNNVAWPALRGFTFHSAILDWNGDGRLDVYLSNLPGPGPGPVLMLQGANGGFSQHNELLPIELTDPETCFMSSHTADLDHDGKVELILGGCDRPRGARHQKRDRVLRFENGRYVFQPIDFLPERRRNSSWGTVALYAGDLKAGHADPNRKPRPFDIVAVTHDFGFKKFDIQIFAGAFTEKGQMQYTEEGFQFSLPEPAGPGFIPWVSSGDLDLDGQLDLLFVWRQTGSESSADSSRLQRLLLYLNRGSGTFAEIGNCLQSKIKEPATGHLGNFMRTPTGQAQILLHDLEGNYELIEYK